MLCRLLNSATHILACYAKPVCPVGKTGYLIVCDTDKIMIGVTEAVTNDKIREDSPYNGEEGLPVDEVAEKVNSKLCGDASRKMFVTAWLGFLDLKTGILSYVHAGHTFPVLIGEEISFVKQKINMMLGGLKRARYIRQEMKLLPGESIYLYTDGVSEAQNAAEEMYGEDRLIALIREKRDELGKLNGNALCKAGCEMVYESVMEFAGDAPQFDDITMMWVKFQG